MAGDSAQQVKQAVATAGRWGLLPILATTTLWLGGVSSTSVAAGCIALVAALAATAPKTQRHLPVTAWALLGLGAFTALQCLPLPTAWVSAVSPSVATAWGDARQLLGNADWTPLSLEPEASRFEAVKWVYYAAVWTATVRLRRVMGLRNASLFVFGLALAVALIAISHRLLHAERVYGVYTPMYATVDLAAPLLNPNNLAGVLMLGAFCGAGFALHVRSTVAQRALAAAGIAALCGATVLTGSRGGTLALALGALGLLGWGWLHRGDEPRLALRTSWLLGGAALSALFVTLAASRQWTLQLLDDSLAKLNLLRWAAEVSRHNPWTGTGRGAFGAEASRFIDEPGDRVFTHAENWIAEWISGWGWPVGLAAVLGLLWLLRPQRCLRRANATRAAVYFGLLALCTQNLVDLGFEIAGVMGLFVFLVAALGVRRRSDTTAAQPTGSGPTWSQITAMGACALGAIWLLSMPPKLAHHERRSIGATVMGSAPLASKAAAVSQAVARHPGDAYLLRLGALVAVDQDRPAVALQWLNASLRRSPRSGSTLLLLGQSLHALGNTPQALLALKQASENTPELAAHVAQLATKWAPERVQDTVSSSAVGVDALVELAAQTPVLSKRIELLDQAIARAPEQTAARLARANAWLDAVQTRQPPCAEPSSRCLDRVKEELAAAPPEASPSMNWVMLRARWLLATGDAKTANAWLSERCSRDRTAAPCIALMLDVAGTLDETAMTAAAERYLDLHCTLHCAPAQYRVGGYYARRGMWGLALDHYHRAASLSDDVDHWLAAAGAAARLQRTNTTQRLLDRAKQAAARDGAPAVARVERARSQLVVTASGGTTAAPLTPSVLMHP